MSTIKLNSEQQAFVEDNMGLAGFMAKKLSNSAPGIEYEDLTSLCYLGLVKAAGTFDPGKGFTFATWATSCIKFTVIKEMRYYRRHNPDLTYLEDMMSDDSLSWEQLLSSNQLNPEDQATDAALLHQLAQQLNDKQKTVLELLTADSPLRPTQNEIATVIGLSQAQVCRLIRQIQYRLRKLLAS